MRDAPEMKEQLEMGVGPGTFSLLSVDFRAARRRIEALTDAASGARARAFAAYVGLFDFADETGIVDVPSERIASTFEISRVSWLSYRSVLVEAGLLEIATRERGTRKALQLIVPQE